MSKRARKLAERIRRLQSDPCNERLARVEDAGRIVDGHLVTHNGLRVQPMDPCYMQLLQANQGCHEPQEEWVFSQVLGRLGPGASIVELGAYWGFYSMWFAREIDDARCFLVEPNPDHLEVGKYNFAHNQLQAEFFCDLVGAGRLGLARFAQQRGLSHIDILHADIQGAEYQMLCDATPLLDAGRIGYVFVGTHSQDLHYRCLNHLQEHGYEILTHADFRHGTYCEDGVLVARSRSLPGLEPLELPLRRPHQPYALRPSRSLARVLQFGWQSLFARRKTA